MLTERKRAFIDYYKSTGNATESAKLAGYKGKYVNRSASRLLHDVDISIAVKEFQETRKEKYSKENYIDTAWKEYEQIEEKPSKIRALELAGKALGYVGSSNDTKTIQNTTNIINIEQINAVTLPERWGKIRDMLEC